MSTLRPDRVRGLDSAVCETVPDLAHIGPDLRALAVDITTLQPAPDNARKHAAKDVQAIAESLATHGQQKPLVGKRWYRGYQSVILCGNGTLQAARALQWPVLAVSWLPDDTSDDDARLLALQDNRAGELSA